MDSLLSVDMLKLRFQAWRRGRPLSELALLQAQRGRLVRLLYLERGSGQLLGQWQADHGEDGRADLISGMIAALTDFARNALGPGGGELRTLDLGGRKIYLRSSSQMIVAAEFMGNLVPKQERQLNDAFLALLEASNAGDAPADALASLGQRLAEAQAVTARAKSRFSPLSIVALLLGAVLAWFAFQSFLHWRHETAIATALQEVLDARPDLAAYPLKIETQHGARQVRLSGLVPSAQDGAALDAALMAAAKPYAFGAALVVIGTQRGLDAADAKTSALSQKVALDTALLGKELSERISAEKSGLLDSMAQLKHELVEARELAAAQSAAGLDDLRQKFETGRARADASLVANLARIDAEALVLQTRLSTEMAAAVLASGHQNAADLAAANAVVGEQLARIEAGTAALQTRLDTEISALRTALAAQIQTEVAAVAGRLAALGGELDAARTTLAQNHAASLRAAQVGIEAVNRRLDTPRAKLDAELRGFAVFFLANDVMVDETLVRERLNAIAKLAMAAGGIRVVGYSDETGTPTRNRALSRLRAEIVVQRLVDAGMDRVRIIVASRTVQTPLADTGDPTNQRNRRVTLEPLYANVAEQHQLGHRFSHRHGAISLS